MTLYLVINLQNTLYNSDFFKKDEQLLEINHIRVRILPTVSKIYERWLYNQWNEYFQPLFSNLQCGFRKFWKWHNVQHCLLVSTEKCCKVSDKRDFACLPLTDLSKDFDCIEHELLIAKLHTYGFNIKSLELIQSYLYDQIKLFIKINPYHFLGSM